MQIKNSTPTITYDRYGQKTVYRNEKRQLHREDGPAIEYTDGRKEWYLNGKLHREDGPAVESSSSKEWWLNDKRHREDGPAIEYANGAESWLLNGELVDKSLVLDIIDHKSGKKRVISKEDLEYLMVDIFDEYEKYEIKTESPYTYSVILYGPTNPKVYTLISSLCYRLEDYGKTITSMSYDYRRMIFYIR